MRCWIIWGFFLFLFFFLSLWHNRSISPDSTLKKTQKRGYGSTAETEDRAPDLFPQVSSACSQGRAGGLSQQTWCCSGGSSSRAMSKGFNLPMDSSGIHVRNTLGSGASKPEAECAPAWQTEEGEGMCGSQSLDPGVCQLLRPLLPYGAYGQGGPKEAGMRQKASLICQSKT